jgi:vancomycin resistance protein YoaR
VAADHERPDQEAERTDVLPPVPPEGDSERTDRISERPLSTEAPTVVGTGWGGGPWPWAESLRSGPPPGSTVPVAPAGGPPPWWRRWRRPGLVAAGVVGGFALLYGIDLAASQGDVPRGVVVAGVEVGGMDRTAAEQRLHTSVDPRLAKPVRVDAGDVTTTVDPVVAGLGVDWPATLAAAGDQPLNPWTRLASFFTDRRVDVVAKVDGAKLTAAVEGLRGKVDRAPVEGTVRFEGTNPVPVQPRAGQQLDLDGAARELRSRWADGDPVHVPVGATPVRTTSQGVQQALDTVARPAVSGPVVVHGDGRDAVLDPATVAGAMSFEPAPTGGWLSVRLDQPKVVAALRPQLASTERPGQDAKIVFDGGRPTVQPSVDGHGVDWDKSLTGLLDVLRRTDNRAIKAQYADQPAKLTTDAANRLGVTEVIGEFTTGGFAADSGVNIHRVADQVNGALVRPGETFSLNGYTGPRTAAQGYVEAGVIEHGAPAREIGGGISQFATTLYNAAYFAAMTDAGHKEHSYYISRYPPAREATVFQNPDGSSVIDLRFRNDNPTGVAIQTIWTPKSITVRLWGTKRYNVESISGQRRDFTPQNTLTRPAGPNCHAGDGGPGFTTDDTRVIRDLGGNEVRRQTRTVRYDPAPRIVCDPAPTP